MSERKIVKCKAAFLPPSAGAPRIVPAGDLYWSDDALVLAHPDKFGDVEVKVSPATSGKPVRRGRTSAAVEQATAAPGGRRRLSRPAPQPVAPAVTPDPPAEDSAQAVKSESSEKEGSADA